MFIKIKSLEEIKKMKISGKLAASVLSMIKPYVKPGVTTNYLDKICHNFITNTIHAIPAPLNYKGFPKSICISINHVVCHGIPSKRIIKNSDILNIDITIIKNGYHADTSKMFFFDKSPILGKKLSKITYKAMWEGIKKVKPGARLGDIGSAIQKYAEYHKFSIVRDFCGHGIGRDFHEDPQILHYGVEGTGEILKEGMTFTIEPMINAGKYFTTTLPDGWTVVTKDRSLSAQYEHTILVTENGYEVLTLREEEKHNKYNNIIF